MNQFQIFFINNQSSPYSNINLNCSYLDMEKLNELSSEKFTVLSLNIQSLLSKFSEFTDLLSIPIDHFTYFLIFDQVL